MWLIYALLSAIFAGLTAILVKVGVSGISANLATAIRTIVVLIMSWMVVFLAGKPDFTSLSKKNITFLILSGLATGASWLTYNRALQLGPASKVIPVDNLSVVIGMVLAFILLRERVTVPIVIGGALITLGVLVISFNK
ncbi:EamA family transporter [Lactococcus fujiensis]|uniref:Drug/metabolite transporter n=1 Tax=Lactococcus fujiensis JCM 16395 TaxID=1291764 RepID=A0A2A5RNT5_9LACT|nr:EamA family transporter [Lactococcus fujiensis]PCS01011.1 drug/metabolite transporter [Lactococcus fujiensis JCM 16395]